MELHLINPNDMWEDSRGNTLWYNNGSNKNLYIIVNMYEIVAFYLIVDDQLVYGRPQEAPLFGKLPNNDNISEQIATIDKKTLSKIAPSEFIQRIETIPSQCKGLDSFLANALQLYLAGDYQALYLKPSQYIETNGVFKEKEYSKKVKNTSKFIWPLLLFIFILFTVYFAVFNKYEPIHKYVWRKDTIKKQKLLDSISAKESILKTKLSEKRDIGSQINYNSKNELTNFTENANKLRLTIELREFNHDVKMLLKLNKNKFLVDSEEFNLILKAKSEIEANESLSALEELCDTHDICFPLADYWLKSQNQKAASVYYKRDCEKFGGKVCELANCSSVRAPASECAELKKRLTN